MRRQRLSVVAIAVLIVLGTLMTGGVAHLQAQVITHLHQLYYGNAKWLAEDLTGFTNGTLAPARSALSSFAMANGTQHVYFMTDNQHVHQLYYDKTRWHDEDLTGFTKGALAAAGSALSSFAMGNGTQHVYFVADNQHVHQLYYDNTKWHDEDLTGFRNGSSAAAGSALSSFVMPDGKQQHVYFVASNQHVHQLYYSTKWLDEDLTDLTNGALAAAGSALSSFVMPDGRQQHVYFVASNQHVHQLYYSTKWLDEDLTGFTNGALAAAGSALSSFVMPDGKQQHVYFVASNQHVHQLYYSTKWLDEDLTDLTNGALAAAGSALSSFVMPDGRQQHVYFVASNQHVHQLYYSTKWLDEDLTGFTKGALAAAGSALSSFAQADGWQHVFYFD